MALPDYPVKLAKTATGVIILVCTKPPPYLAIISSVKTENESLGNTSSERWRLNRYMLGQCISYFYSQRKRSMLQNAPNNTPILNF